MYYGIIIERGYCGILGQLWEIIYESTGANKYHTS